MKSQLILSGFAYRAIQFFSSLDLTIPKELVISILDPYKNDDTLKCVNQFFQKYFNDNRKRIFLLGINPGRFGGGLTGISFTDPVALRTICGIENDFGTKRELSSEFIYMVIEEYGGVKKFYHDIFMSAICPLGFTKGNLNYNYYDTKPLLEVVTPFIRETFQQQIEIGARKNALVCIGAGKNLKFISAMNDEIGYFDKIIALEHPRFIMQYRRKKVDRYIQLYVNTLQEIVE